LTFIFTYAPTNYDEKLIDLDNIIIGLHNSCDWTEGAFLISIDRGGLAARTKAHCLIFFAS
jgi:hypothetical protein